MSYLMIPQIYLLFELVLLRTCFVRTYSQTG